LAHGLGGMYPVVVHLRRQHHHVNGLPQIGTCTLTLDGKVALVTGASRGIGRSIAERLASDGAGVVVNYYPPERAEAEDVVRGIEEDGGTAIAAAADVADAAQLRGLFDVAQQRFGQLDIVVLNAANVRRGTIVDTSDEEFDAMFATNARGSFIALRESAIRLRDGGRIVAISAGLSIMPCEGTGVYAASKAAVNHLVRVLAREVGHRGVSVNAVLPGAVLTPALLDAGPEVIEAEIARTPLGRVGLPQDIADIVGFLVSEQGGWITGQLLGAGGGMF
jgi:3-oxoacyl-[acyl-carrier protein] reductase